MKYAVGYQLPFDNENITDTVLAYKDHISEVYFSWVHVPSGRSAVGSRDGYTDWDAQNRMIADLKQIKASGIRLDLVMNANCMGEAAMSVGMANNLCSIIDYIGEQVGSLEVVTTASPAIAYIVKSSYPQIEVRASVNMRIGTVKAVEYIADLFDSFYIQRECNRDFVRIAELKTWSEKNGKTMHFLANSGCLDHCSGQTFHDNIVAHEAQISQQKNISGFTPQVCRRYYANAANQYTLLQNCWVRPEDIHHYNEHFQMAKLATRQHSNPSLVVLAYVTGRYYGNLLDLLEPSNGDLIAPFILDNSAFPQDWFATTSACKKQCEGCDYCKELFDKLRIVAL